MVRFSLRRFSRRPGHHPVERETTVRPAGGDRQRPAPISQVTYLGNGGCAIRPNCHREAGTRQPARPLQAKRVVCSCHLVARSSSPEHWVRSRTTRCVAGGVTAERRGRTTAQRRRRGPRPRRSGRCLTGSTSGADRAARLLRQRLSSSFLPPKTRELAGVRYGTAATPRPSSRAIRSPAPHCALQRPAITT